MSDDIIKRLREAIAEHPLSPIHGYAADIAALLDRLDEAREAARTWENEAERRSRRYEECAVKLDAAERECERLRESIGMAYGYLWCVNNEPGTPHQYPPERAAYEARKLLRDTMTSEQRGTFINRAVALVRGGKTTPPPSTAIDAARAAERGKE